MTETGMFVREAGSGAPVVFLHGWSCDGSFFDNQFEALSGSALCVAPDLPGHGRTGDALPLTIEAAADAVHALLQERALTGALLCGWSMGAHVAFALAKRHGTDRLKAILAIDMSPKVLNAPDWEAGSKGGLDATRNKDVLKAIADRWPDLAPHVARRIFAQDRVPNKTRMAMTTSRISACRPELMGPMWASLTDQDFRQFLPSLEIPLHLAYGKHSALYGSKVRKWYIENIQNLVMHEFRNSGHAPHLEEPEQFNSLLKSLL